MDRAHRQELKHDKFVEQVGHTVEYAAEHRTLFTRLAIGAGIALLVVAGTYVYMQRQETVRQDTLREAMRTLEAQIGPPQELFKTFATEAEKDKAVEKELSDVANRWPTKREGLIAKYLLGTTAADKGRTAESEKHLKQVIEDADAPLASQAKLSLSQVYAAQGKTGDAEKLLRSLISKPTYLVSKEQATIALARVYMRSKPAEARKLLEPLRTESGPASRLALTALSEMPAQP